MTDLKPCPFCGSGNVALYTEPNLVDVDKNVYSVWCEDCFVTGPEADTGDLAEDLWNAALRRDDPLASARVTSPVPDFVRTEALAEIDFTVGCFCEQLSALRMGQLGINAFVNFEHAEDTTDLAKLQWALAVHRGEQP